MVWFPEWTTHPIPGVSLSAGGLLALADLSTVGMRTVITGGSSWLDTLLLAPGLHYQQAADELARRTSSNAILSAVEPIHGTHSVTLFINNAATASYIQRIAKPGETVTLSVGLRLRRSQSGLHATIFAVNDIPDLGWLSHVFYLISPALTIAALVLTVLLRDWWALGSLLALMISRMLNIWVIKQRTKHHASPRQPPPIPTEPSTDSDQTTTSTPGAASPHPHLARLTEYIVSLSDGRPSTVKLRGTSDDLRAVTAESWLRSKTHLEGYLEAAAKLIVFLVAAVSGNMTQAGAIAMMALLLVTAGLLALSNANAKAFRINGRVAAPEEEEERKGMKGHVVEGRVVGTGAEGGQDLAEKGMGYSSG
ncbi:hypothetical protein QBC34DRAFT_129279 [Podospora aff. communis PSN243]|uniref:Uncharacterized protein n=1 Tax=Podospora aff. communis PSN243 TaxID=3040156 RepID=A0AAV9GJD6_9PEZI|nr:hypothetical protein QBC34DRAFT_129279 [Podospora aff. communis PSN243]